MAHAKDNTVSFKPSFREYFKSSSFMEEHFVRLLQIMNKQEEENIREKLKEFDEMRIDLNKIIDISKRINPQEIFFFGSHLLLIFLDNSENINAMYKIITGVRKNKSSDQAIKRAQTLFYMIFHDSRWKFLTDGIFVAQEKLDVIRSVFYQVPQILALEDPLIALGLPILDEHVLHFNRKGNLVRQLEVIKRHSYAATHRSKERIVRDYNRIRREGLKEEAIEELKCDNCFVYNLDLPGFQQKDLQDIVGKGNFRVLLEGLPLFRLLILPQDSVAYDLNIGAGFTVRGLDIFTSLQLSNLLKANGGEALASTLQGLEKLLPLVMPIGHKVSFAHKQNISGFGAISKQGLQELLAIKPKEDNFLGYAENLASAVRILKTNYITNSKDIEKIINIVGLKGGYKSCIRSIAQSISKGVKANELSYPLDAKGVKTTLTALDQKEQEEYLGKVRELEATKGEKRKANDADVADPDTYLDGAKKFALAGQEMEVI